VAAAYPARTHSFAQTRNIDHDNLPFDRLFCARPPVLAPAVSSFFNDRIIPRSVRGCQFDGERLFLRSIRVTLTLLFGFDAAALMTCVLRDAPCGRSSG
jgi:hypothetical protein